MPFNDPRPAVRAAAERGVYLAGEHLLGVAVQNAPVDEGTLRNSGATSTDGTKAVVSFDTPYAARQHEELTWHHPRGGGAKYLEKALGSERDAISKVIATTIRRTLGS